MRRHRVEGAVCPACRGSAGHIRIDVEFEAWEHDDDDGGTTCNGIGLLRLIDALGELAPTMPLETLLDALSDRLRWCDDHPAQELILE